MNRLYSALVALALATHSMGCATVYIKKASALEGLSEPRPALLATSVVRVGDPSAQDGGGDVALNVAMKPHLEAFGLEMTEVASAFVAQHGLRVVKDAERAQRLSLFTGKDKIVGVVGALTGFWYSPEGSTHVVDSSINYVFNKKQNVERADDPETPNEAFVFVTGTITKTTAWLVMAKPMFRMEIRVLDEQGEDLMRVSGVGEGDAAPFFMDRSKGNLEKALKGALETLKVTPVEAL
ncbi:MAG: hypothetical protein VYB65_14035 [Myxococcota bacterium]|nr:hypothetical protein [Myxococcota bacterium]